MHTLRRKENTLAHWELRRILQPGTEEPESILGSGIHGSAWIWCSRKVYWVMNQWIDV